MPAAGQKTSRNEDDATVGGFLMMCQEPVAGKGAVPTSTLSILLPASMVRSAKGHAVIASVFLWSSKGRSILCQIGQTRALDLGSPGDLCPTEAWGPELGGVREVVEPWPRSKSRRRLSSAPTALCAERANGSPRRTFLLLMCARFFQKAARGLRC